MQFYHHNQYFKSIFDNSELKKKLKLQKNGTGGPDQSASQPNHWAHQYTTCKSMKHEKSITLTRDRWETHEKCIVCSQSIVCSDKIDIP